MCFSPIASGLFCIRNTGKAKNGETGRETVAALQGLTVAQALMKLDNTVSKSATSAFETLSKFSQGKPLLEGTGKLIKFGTGNINSLIGVAGAIKVANSDDKLESGITEAGALTTMVAGEALFKQNYESIAKTKTVQEGIQTLSESKVTKPVFEYLAKNKAAGGRAGAVAKGLGLFTVSLGGYALGHCIAKDGAKEICSKIGHEIKAPKAEFEAAA